MIQSCIVCICWTFSSVCVQMSPQIACLREGLFTSVAFIWHPPLCVFKCLFKLFERKLCSSISSILYLFITSLPQFDVAHGQALLYVGHHHVLQGKGIDLQNVVLLHLDLTPVWRSTWSGSALYGPPPSPPHEPHEPELQTHSLSLIILWFFSFEKISVGDENNTLICDPN